MNYRHGFHAGNFADLAKHAAVLGFLRLLKRKDAPLLVVDTHAGAGFYDLSSPDFARSKEAEAGIGYLMGRDVPASLRALADYVRAKNAAAGFRDRIGIYPGSPMLVLDHQRAGDDYVGAELRDDDFRLLRDRIEPRGQAVQEDGYDVAVEAANDDKDLFYLIDPPFEKVDDYARIVASVRDVLALRPDAHFLIWLPLKDLETFDSFLRGLEAMAPPAALAVETRLSPLTDPMRMNGCALVILNPPPGLEAPLKSIADWVVANAGGPGGLAKLWKLNG